MATARFKGTVQRLKGVDCGALAAWIGAISYEDWPQQLPLTQPPQLYPAMVSDPEWHGFKARTDGLVGNLMADYPDCAAYNRLLSVVMPGDSIRPHVDEQPASWRFRIHAPLLADGQAVFRVGGDEHNLTVGNAYLVNTLVEHEVRNPSASPRVHFMFDVRLI